MRGKNALQTLLALDGRLVVRHRFLHVVLVMAILFGVLVRFAVPEHVDGEKQAIVLGQAAPGADVPDNVTFVASRVELDRALDKDNEAMGLALGDGDAVTVIQRGYEDARTRSMVIGAAAVVATRVRGRPLPVSHEITLLRAPTPPPPLNGSMLPLLFAADIVMLGFLFGAVMVLQEKSFATLYVYRVTPGGSLPYIGSKLLLNVGMAALGMLILMAIAVPAALTIPMVWVLVLGTAAGITLLGIGMAVFFPNLSAFFYPLIVVSMALSVPIAAYFLPSLDVGLLKLLPTYHVMFATRELMYPTGKEGLVTEAVVAIGAFLVLTAAFTYMAVAKRLLEEGK